MYAPSGLAVVLSVWIGAPDLPEPEYRSTVTDRRSPDAVPAVPLNDGWVSFVKLPFVGLLSDISGGVVSIVNVL